MQIDTAAGTQALAILAAKGLGRHIEDKRLSRKLRKIDRIVVEQQYFVVFLTLQFFGEHTLKRMLKGTVKLRAGHIRTKAS